MMKVLRQVVEKKERTVIGLMSGTSMDGVDAAVVRIRNSGPATSIEVIDYLTSPYPESLQQRLLHITSGGEICIEEVCMLHFLTGELFADAALSAIKKARIRASEVDFIGSHGQTVSHLPVAKDFCGYSVRGTLQLGESSTIAKKTGIPTIADFRPGDMALAGQGAPLIPYFDYIMFSSPDKNRAALNIGGIANLTILQKRCGLEKVVAYDTGPGNMAVDFLMKELYKKPYDKGGKTARSGRISEPLLEIAMAHPFFQEKPPKSTGREQFGAEFCQLVCDKASDMGLPANDIITTITELTVQSILDCCRSFGDAGAAFDELIVSGGGVHNKYIMNGLNQNDDNIAVNAVDAYGIPSPAKEAVCFAVLANETIMGNAANVPSATGASEATVLGKLSV
jgi:anhydro-N-acetylmuramic acid kinase